MKKIDVGQVLTILANAGVIVGIVFLAFEIQQNNDLLREQARAGIVSEIGALNAALYENTGGLGEIAVKALNGEGLTEQESYRLQRYQAQNLVLWQSAFFSLEADVIEEEDMVPRGLATMFHQVIPGMQDQYDRIKGNLDPAFVEWMDTNVVSRE